MRRPNGLFLELHGSGGTELEVAAYYDGKTVSLQSDVREVWAQTDGPGTLDEMLDDVAVRFSLPLPRTRRSARLFTCERISVRPLP